MGLLGDIDTVFVNICLLYSCVSLNLFTHRRSINSFEKRTPCLVCRISDILIRDEFTSSILSNMDKTSDNTT